MAFPLPPNSSSVVTPNQRPGGDAWLRSYVQSSLNFSRRRLDDEVKYSTEHGEVPNFRKTEFISITELQRLSNIWGVCMCMYFICKTNYLWDNTNAIVLYIDFPSPGPNGSDTAQKHNSEFGEWQFLMTHFLRSQDACHSSSSPPHSSHHTGQKATYGRCSLPPPYATGESNSGGWAWLQASLPTAPSRRPLPPCFLRPYLGVSYFPHTGRLQKSLDEDSALASSHSRQWPLRFSVFIFLESP